MDVMSLNTQPVYNSAPEVRAEPAAVESTSLVTETAQPAASERITPERETDELENRSPRQIEGMLEKGLQEVNKKLAVVSNAMQYSYHKPTRTVSVKVYNTETKEVIREIPPQKDLEALAKMWELAGIVVDEKK